MCTYVISNQLWLLFTARSLLYHACVFQLSSQQNENKNKNKIGLNILVLRQISHYVRFDKLNRNENNNYRSRNCYRHFDYYRCIESSWMDFSEHVSIIIRSSTSSLNKAICQSRSVAFNQPFGCILQKVHIVSNQHSSMEWNPMQNNLRCFPLRKLTSIHFVNVM